MSLKPEVAWAQREDSLLVIIRVSNIHDLKIEQTASTLSFSGKGGAASATNFAVDLEFFADINPEVLFLISTTTRSTSLFIYTLWLSFLANFHTILLLLTLLIFFRRRKSSSMPVKFS